MGLPEGLYNNIFFFFFTEQASTNGNSKLGTLDRPLNHAHTGGHHDFA